MVIDPVCGMYVDEKKAIYKKDVDGKTLVQKYIITKVPTIVLSSDASVYSALDNYGKMSELLKMMDSMFLEL